MVLYSLWMAFSSWANVSNEKLGPDAVAIQQLAIRLEPAIERLQTIAAVRYVGSPSPSGKQTDLSRRPMMAYILAPIALSEQSDSQVILADFNSDRELAEHFRGKPMIVLAHLAPGE